MECGKHTSSCTCYKKKLPLHEKFRDFLIPRLKINGKNFDKDVISLYWETLKQFDLSLIEQAIENIYKKIDSTKYRFFPEDWKIKKECYKILHKRILKTQEKSHYCKDCGAVITIYSYKKIMNNEKVYCTKCHLILYKDSFSPLPHIPNFIDLQRIEYLKNGQEVIWEEYLKNRDSNDRKNGYKKLQETAKSVFKKIKV